MHVDVHFHQAVDAFFVSNRFAKLDLLLKPVHLEIRPRDPRTQPFTQPVVLSVSSATAAHTRHSVSGANAPVVRPDLGVHSNVFELESTAQRAYVPHRGRARQSDVDAGRDRKPLAGGAVGETRV